MFTLKLSLSCSVGVIPRPSASVRTSAASLRKETYFLSHRCCYFLLFSQSPGSWNLTQIFPPPHVGLMAWASSLLGITSNQQQHLGPQHLHSGQLSDILPVSRDKPSSCLNMSKTNHTLVHQLPFPVTSTELLNDPQKLLSLCWVILTHSQICYYFFHFKNNKTNIKPPLS